MTGAGRRLAPVRVIIMRARMTTITHRHSRPHHNDEPDAFLGLDDEATSSAGEVISTATSAEYVSDPRAAELTKESDAPDAPDDDLSTIGDDLVDLGRSPYHGSHARRGHLT
jgi:hypothetical protein